MHDGEIRFFRIQARDSHQSPTDLFTALVEGGLAPRGLYLDDEDPASMTVRMPDGDEDALRLVWSALPTGVQKRYLPPEPVC